MIIVPKEKPVLQNLSSYYLEIPKLLEQSQKEVGSGCIYFKSQRSEGIIFFDKEKALNGVLQEEGGEIHGNGVFERVVELGGKENFTINVYWIDPEMVYFWANIPMGERIYKDLSTEFTDIEGLIKKMVSEKLTGYIEVSIVNGKEGGLIFFNKGEMIGGSYSWGKGELDHSKENQRLLIQKTKESGGVFQVNRVPLKKGKVESKESGQEAPLDILFSLSELLKLFEKTVSLKKNIIKTEFDALLRKKYLEKAEKYPFLDPFAGEFEYSDGKIKFSGEETREEEVAKGIIEIVKEFIEEYKILDAFKSELLASPYKDDFQRLGLGL